MPDGVGNPIQDCPGKEKKEPEEVVEPHKITFTIVDDKNAPLPDVSIQVLLPDGSSEERQSLPNGQVIINNVKPGKCKLDSDWKGLYVKDTVFLQ